MLHLNCRGLGNVAEKVRCKNKYIRIKSLIRENNSNIVTLNELCVQHNNKTKIKKADLEREFKDFNVYLGGNEVAIFVKKAINSTEAKIDAKDKINGKHWSIYSLIYSGSKPIIIGSYYRSPSENENPVELNKELNVLRDKYKCKNFIINGDFNAEHELWDNNCDPSKIDGNASGILELLEEQEMAIMNNKFKPTHAKYNNVNSEDIIIPIIYGYNSIDLTLVSLNLQNMVNNWDTNSYTIYGADRSEMDLQWISNISDHFAITYQINAKIEKNGKGIKQAWRLNSEHWDEYNEILGILLIHWNEYCDFFENDANKVDEMIDLLTKAILIAAISTIGIKKYDNNSVGWINRKILDLIAAIKRIKRRISKNKKKNKINNELIQLLKKERKRLKIMIKMAKIKENNKLGENICKNVNDTKSFYKYINKALRKKFDQIPPMQKKDGTFTANITEKAEMCHEYFTSKPKENEYSEESQQFHLFVENKIKEAELEEETKSDDEWKQFNGKNSEILNRVIMEQEVYKAVKGLKRENAMGPDQVHNVMIIEGKELLVPALTRAYNICLKHKKWAFMWKLSNYGPMPKPGKDATQVKNIRALQISSTLSRIGERIMANRLVTYMKINGFINEWNVAYQGNKSIDEIIADLSNDIYETLEMKFELEMIFFDLSKAYDTVWLEGLLYKLKYYYKINGTFWQLLKSFLTNRFNRVVINGVVTKWKKHSYGIPQGGPLSPLIFIIYINDFAVLCREIKFRKYADDTSAWQKPGMLQYRQNHNNYNQIKHNTLQLECNNYVNWCNLWKLCINYDKCESMFFFK